MKTMYPVGAYKEHSRNHKNLGNPFGGFMNYIMLNIMIILKVDYKIYVDLGWKAIQ
jgi:hypothetical protein